MNLPRASMSRLGLGAFGVLLGAVVAVLLWGLFTIDRVLATAETQQREAVADYSEALVRRALEVQPPGPRQVQLQNAAAALLTSVRHPPASVALISGTDTVIAPQSAQIGPASRRTSRTIQLPGGEVTVLVTASPRTVGSRPTLWVIGVLSILLLGVAVVRERQHSGQVAARSRDIERLSIDALRANAMKSEFLANVSHELRTPLTAIVGFVEMLRDGVYGELGPRQVGPVDRIAASATHLRHLVDQILDIARIAAGRLEVSREVISLRPFVLNVASELESLFSERSLRLSITVSSTLPRVRTDPTHLRHVLVNLLGNAVKYTSNGGVAVRARLVVGAGVEARRTPDDPVLSAKAPKAELTWIALQVVDTGIGIAERDRERIFDEFEQVNAGPRTDSVERGTGLGLAISRRLARSLGGDLSVESTLGKGSTFTFWLPVDAADLTAIVVPAEAPVESAPRSRAIS